MKHLTDTHAHTVASTHAYSTVEEYFRAASEKGLQLFSITDHGQRCLIHRILGILEICAYFLGFDMGLRCCVELRRIFVHLNLVGLM